MGRRKIEIQPILHDRNRSVTFLKRKNGLFKKAYELGVLCSVDVVVIVFGHNQKLYEYSSAANGSSNKIIDKRLNYAGEKESRGPHDFGSDKGVDADDGDGAEESDDPQPSTNNRRQPPTKSLSKSSKDTASTIALGRAGSGHVASENHDTRRTSSNSRAEPDRSSPPPIQTQSQSATTASALSLAQLLANSVTGLPPSFDPHHQQSQAQFASFGSQLGLHNPGQGQLPSTQDAMATASASLAHLLSANPYIASQLSSLSSYNPHLNPGSSPFGLGPGGGLGIPGYGLHPLYSSPLFATLLAQTQHQQQNQQSGPGIGTTSALQHGAFSAPPPFHFPSSIGGTGGREGREESSRPRSPARLQMDWPTPPSVNGSSSGGRDTQGRNDRRGRSGSPSQDIHIQHHPSHDNGSSGQASTWLDFLNAISAPAALGSSLNSGSGQTGATPYSSQGASGLGLGAIGTSLPGINSMTAPATSGMFGQAGGLFGGFMGTVGEQGSNAGTHSGDAFGSSGHSNKRRRGDDSRGSVSPHRQPTSLPSFDFDSASFVSGNLRDRRENVVDGLDTRAHGSAEASPSGSGSPGGSPIPSRHGANVDMEFSAGAFGDDGGFGGLEVKGQRSSVGFEDSSLLHISKRSRTG